MLLLVKLIFLTREPRRSNAKQSPSSQSYKFLVILKSKENNKITY